MEVEHVKVCSTRCPHGTDLFMHTCAACEAEANKAMYNAGVRYAIRQEERALDTIKGNKRMES